MAFENNNPSKHWYILNAVGLKVTILNSGSSVQWLMNPHPLLQFGFDCNFSGKAGFIFLPTLVFSVPLASFFYSCAVNPISEMIQT